MRSVSRSKHKWSIARALENVSRDLGMPAQECVLCENFGKHMFELGLLTRTIARSDVAAAVLDIGGGLGVNLLAARRLVTEFTDLTLLDRFDEYGPLNRMGDKHVALKLLKQSNIRVVRGDIWQCHSVPFATASFDVVTIFDVLEHLPGHPIDVLKDVCRVLKPGGVLILGGPNAISLMKRLRLLFGTHPYIPFDLWCGEVYFSHYREYTPKEYRELLTRSGFSIEQTFLVPEPSKTRARRRYHNRVHALVSPKAIALIGAFLVHLAVPTLRPAVYILAHPCKRG